MKNIKTQVVSLIAILGLVASPIVGLAQTSISSQPTSVEQAREAFKKELDGLRAAREAFKNARKEEAEKRATEAKEKNEARKKEAEEKRKDAEMRREAHRKEVLLRLIGVQIKYFQNVERRVANMPNISDAKKAELKTAIDNEIAVLNALKVKVNAAKTADELKALTQEIRDNLKTKREIVHKIVDAITAEVLQDLVAKAEDRIKTAEAKIAALKAAGKDTTELDKLLATAKDKLAAAKTNLTRDALEDARDALKDLYSALKEFTEKSGEK